MRDVCGVPELILVCPSPQKHLSPWTTLHPETQLRPRMHPLLLRFGTKRSCSLPEAQTHLQRPNHTAPQNHEAFSCIQDLNPKDTKKSQVFPQWQPDSSTHITVLWPCCQQKSRLQFVSLASILLNSSITTVWKLPLERHLREPRNGVSSQGRARSANICCLLVCPSVLSDASDLIFDLGERARRQERRGRGCSAESLVLQPCPSAAPAAAPCFLFPPWSTQWAAGLFCTLHLHYGFPGCSLPRNETGSARQDYLLITKPLEFAWLMHAGVVQSWANDTCCPHCVTHRLAQGKINGHFLWQVPTEIVFQTSRIHPF